MGAGGRGNGIGGAYPQGYGGAWGGVNGAIAAVSGQGYGAAGVLGPGSGGHRGMGGSRKGFSQR